MARRLARTRRTFRWHIDGRSARRPRCGSGRRQPPPETGRDRGDRARQRQQIPLNRTCGDTHSRTFRQIEESDRWRVRHGPGADPHPAAALYRRRGTGHGAGNSIGGVLDDLNAHYPGSRSAFAKTTAKSAASSMSSSTARMSASWTARRRRSSRVTRWASSRRWRAVDDLSASERLILPGHDPGRDHRARPGSLPARMLRHYRRQARRCHATPPPDESGAGRRPLSVR